MLRPPAPPAPVRQLCNLTPVSSVLTALIIAACSVDRDRPTGVPDVIPSTEVVVSAPETDDLVPADSLVTVEVVATGLLQSVGFVLLTRAQGDTLDQGLEPLDEPLEAVRVVFETQIPNLPTGTILALIGLADDVAGDRTFSEPVFVQVIQCTVFVIACQ